MKRDVTYDDISSFFNDQETSKRYLEIKTNHYKIYKKLIKEKKWDDRRWEDDEINLFAAWIVDGFKRSPTDDGDTVNVRYANYNNDIRPLITECDLWNMEQQTQYRPLFELHNYESVKYHHNNIYYQLKRRVMPYGAPWEDDQINSFAAWILDGLKEFEKNPDSIIVPFYPKDITYGDDYFPKNYKELNFDDHVAKMFTPGHQKRMIEIKSRDPKGPQYDLDLSGYESVVKYRVNIIQRLLGPKYSGNPAHTQMPRYNPWPRKNIALFYAWAVQEEPRKDRTSEFKPKENSAVRDYYDKVKVYPITPEYKR